MDYIHAKCRVHFKILWIAILALAELCQDLLKLEHFLLPDAVVDFVSIRNYPLLQLCILLRILLVSLDAPVSFRIRLAILVNEAFVDERLELLPHLH